MISFSQTGGTSGITTISISATSNSELVNLVNDYTLGNGNGHSLLMPIIQKAYVPTEKYITFSPVTMSIGSSGGTASLNVQSNDNWVIVADDWIQLSRFMDIDRGPQTISGDGNTIIGIRLFENIGEARTGTISGYCVSDSSITASTVVSQAGSYVKPYIVLGSYSADVQYNASSYTFSVSSNTSWNVTTDARWVTLNTLSGTGNSNVSYSVLANSGEHRRTATITVFNADEGITANFTLVQEAEQEYPYIKVEPNSFNVSWSGTSGNVISVSANCDYDITTDVAWITTNAASGSGNGSVSFTTLPNSGSSDAGNIVLANSAVSQVVSVQRQAVGKYLSASTSSISIKSTGGTVDVSVYSNVDWLVSVSNNDAWISVEPLRGSNDGTIRISSSSASSTRTGSIVLMNLEYGLNWTISVKQIVQPSNLIYYTSTDGNIVAPNDTTNRWGANIVSNTYVDGVGIIEFDGPVTMVPCDAFKNLTRLETIHLPNTVSIIEYDAFKRCDDFIGDEDEFVFLGSIIDDPSNITLINDDSGLFAYCESISSVTIDDSVTLIPKETFAYCTSLTSLTLNDNVTYIGSSAFTNCPLVGSFVMPTACTFIGGNTFNNAQFSSVTLTLDAGGAFQNNTQMKTLVLGDSITGISSSNAFKNAYLLEEIYSYNPTGPYIWDFSGAFANAGRDVVGTKTIHVPSGSISSYYYNHWHLALPNWTFVDDL